MDRFGQFVLAASISAVNDSGLDFEKTDRYRCGVIIGSGIGWNRNPGRTKQGLNVRGLTGSARFTVPRLMVNAPRKCLDLIPAYTDPTPPSQRRGATGANAIGDAARYIQHDQADVMIGRRIRKRRYPLWAWQLLRRPRLSTRNDDPQARQPAPGTVTVTDS